MRRKQLAPDSPELTAAVLKRIREMSPEELLAHLAWWPEGVRETWMNEPNRRPPVTDGSNPSAE
jgi:uncharacterized protein (DUF2267 family)